MSRTAISDYSKPGVDFDFAPFDSPAVVEIVRATGLTAKVRTSAQWHNALKHLNAAAIFWRWRQASAKSPTDTVIRKELASLHSAAQRMLGLLPVRYEESVDPVLPAGPIEIMPEVVPWQPLKQFLRDNSDAMPASGPTGQHLPVNPHVVDAIAYPLDEPMRELIRARLASDTDIHGNEPTPTEIFGADSPSDMLVVLVELLTLIEGATALAISQTDEAAGTESALNAVGTDHGSADAAFFDALCKIYAELFSKAPALSRDKIAGKPGGPFLRFASACFTALGDPRPDETIASWYRDRRARQKKQALQT